MSHSPPHLEDRYGAPRTGLRRLLLGLVAVVALGALAWLSWVIWFTSTPDVQSSMPRFEIADSHRASATVVVHLRNDTVEASCLVRAFAQDHTIVGEQNFTVTGVEGRVSQTVDVRTERKATSLELIGCTSPEQSRPR